jgi:FlaA1/EpsC-like NDP-sugar epimerase
MIELDKKTLKYFNKKSIFVTGGTGSLGKELISILLQKTMLFIQEMSLNSLK